MADRLCTISKLTKILLDDANVAARYVLQAAGVVQTLDDDPDLAGAGAVNQTARWAYFAALALGGDEDDAVKCADQLVTEFTEEIVQILVEMKTPGSNYLFLTHEISVVSPPNSVPPR